MQTHPCLQSDPLHTPLKLCRKLLAAMGDLKDRLLEHFESKYPGHSALIRQAVAEAEEIAWQTSFPHLLLPDLVEVRVAEKFVGFEHAEAALVSRAA